MLWQALLQDCDKTKLCMENMNEIDIIKELKDKIISLEEAINVHQETIELFTREKESKEYQLALFQGLLESELEAIR